MQPLDNNKRLRSDNAWNDTDSHTKKIKYESQDITEIRINEIATLNLISNEMVICNPNEKNIYTQPDILVKANNGEWENIEKELKYVSQEMDKNTDTVCPYDKSTLIELLAIVSKNNQMNLVIQILTLSKELTTELWDHVDHLKDLPKKIWQYGLQNDWENVHNELQNCSTRMINASLGGITFLLFAAHNNQWDIVKSILKLFPRADVEASSSGRDYKDIRLLWFAAKYNQWDIVETIFALNEKPTVDNASPLSGPSKGMTVLFFAIWYQKWDFAEKLIDSYPGLSVNACPSAKKSALKGCSVLWGTLFEHQWDLANKMFDYDRKADINKFPKNDEGVSCLGFATVHKKYAIVKKMLEIDPKPDFNAEPIKNYCDEASDCEEVSYSFKNDPCDRCNYFDSVITILVGNFNAEINKDKDLSAIISYLLILGIDLSKIYCEISIVLKKHSIFATLNRIITLFNDRWNNPSNAQFKNFPFDGLIEDMALKVLYLEQPKLKSFLPTIMLEKIQVHSEISYQANHTKALNHIAILAFNEFRWQNGLSDQNYTKGQIENFHRLILVCLKEYEQTHKGVQYTKERRELLVKEIGEDQNIDFPILQKEFIQNAIFKAMSAQPVDNCSDGLEIKNSDTHTTINLFVPSTITLENIDDHIAKGKGKDQNKAELLRIAFNGEWNLVKEKLEEYPENKLDAKILLRLLWIAATGNHQNWNFIRELFDLISWSNLNISLLEGPWTTQELLVSAANTRQWDIVKKTLEINPKVDLTNTYDSFIFDKQNLNFNNYQFLNHDIRVEAQSFTDLISNLTALDVIMIASDTNSFKENQEDKEKLKIVMSYLIFLLGVDGPKTDLEWKERLKSIDSSFNKSITNLNSPWSNPLGEAVQCLIKNNSTINLNDLLKTLVFCPPSLEWEEKAQSIILTLDRVTENFNDPWLSLSGEFFQDLLEKLTSQTTLEAIYKEHPELNSFPSSVTKEKLAAFAINKHKVIHENALNEVAEQVFEFLLQCEQKNQKDSFLDLFDYPDNFQSYNKNQIKDVHRLIVTCLKEFQQMHEGVPFTEEKIKCIVEEIGKNQNVSHPRLKKHFIEKAIMTAMNS